MTQEDKVTTQTATININMRCIEISAKLVKQNTKKEININMRCIEICNSRRIESIKAVININMRCIEIV